MKRAALVLSCVALGCAQIDVSNTVSVEPREAAPARFGGEQFVAREFVADYVQVGPRLLVEIRELRTCVDVRHQPVLRSEHVHRSTHGSVIWEFVIGGFAGGFAAVAFARPQLFSNRLVDGMGRELRDYSGAWIVGGVFSAIGAGLLTAGIVDAIRSRDTTHYADAWEPQLGDEHACDGAEGRPLGVRGLHLRIPTAQLELESATDETGRARFELPAWTGEAPATGQLRAVIEIATLDGAAVEPRVLVLPLRAPWGDMLDANAGVADTRATRPDAPAPEPAPESAPEPAPESAPEPEPEGPRRPDAPAEEPP